MSDRRLHEGRVVTAGFIPLLDCALLVVAHEKGFAEREGVRLRLVREVSWANVRDRVAFGHFDAAHMLGPMVLASHFQAGPDDVPFVAPAALGVGGNAITVSSALWVSMRRHGAHTGAAPAVQARALGAVVAGRAALGLAPLTLAMVFPFSCHNYQLRDWLVMGSIDPDHDVRLVVVPPPLLVEAIRTGQVDGFCVGEPWSSLAVEAGLGAIVAVGSDIWKRPPEKVLGMRADYVQQHPETCAALVRAVRAAARWAGDEGNHPELARLLAQSRYVGAPETVLLAALQGALVMTHGGAPVLRPDFLQLDEAATVPRKEDARMLCERMARWGQVPSEPAAHHRAVGSFRADVPATNSGSPLSGARAIPG